MKLSTTQTAEILLLAAEAGRLFAQEYDAPLDPGATDWDGTAWADARRALAWIDTLLPETHTAAWDLYQHTLVAETQRLVAWPWRVFGGSETRQVDGVTGRAAQPQAWYVEPKTYAGDVLYSPAFDTRAAAEAWAARQADEEAQ